MKPMANPMPNANQIKLFSSIPFYLFSFDEIVKADLDLFWPNSLKTRFEFDLVTELLSDFAWLTIKTSDLQL